MEKIAEPRTRARVHGWVSPFSIDQLATDKDSKAEWVRKFKVLINDIGSPDPSTGALGLGTDIADIPHVTSSGIRQFAGRGERHHLAFDVKTTRQFSRHIGRNPIGIARSGLTGDEQEIAHVDGGAQNARRRQL